MEKKKVKTPAYWCEKEYQPLIEVETIFGNTVKIPSGYKEHWDLMMDMSELIISKQGREVGLQTIRELMIEEPAMPSRNRVDFYLVFAEAYEEEGE